MDAMKEFFLYVFATVIPTALMSEPLIYFLAIGYPHFLLFSFISKAVAKCNQHSEYIYTKANGYKIY